MKLIYTVFLLLFFGVSTLSAQQLKAVAEYQQEYHMPDGLSSRGLSAEQISRMSQRINSMDPREFTLAVQGQRSGYQSAGSTESNRQGAWANFGGGGNVFKDTESLVSLSRVTLQDTVYLVKDTLPDWKWELHEETIELGPLVCYMATTTVMPPTGGMRGGAGQENRGRRGAEEPVEIVAWYCPEIESDQGPGKYWGLPGLILVVEEAASTIQCTNIELFPENFEGVNFPEDGLEISAREYGMKMRKLLQERREQRGARN